MSDSSDNRAKSATEVDTFQDDAVQTKLCGGPSSTFNFAFATDFAKPRPPKEFLLQHFGIPSGRVNIITGAASAAKTLAAQDLALAVAAGHPTAWGGLKVGRQGSVRHLDYEMGSEDIGRRYVRLAFGRNVDMATLGTRLGVASLPEIYLNSKAAEPACRTACEGMALLVVDSFAAATPREDGNDARLRVWLDMLSRVSLETDCVVVVLLHEGLALNRARGTTAIKDAAGAMISIVANRSSQTLTQTKPNGRPGSPRRFKIVDVGEWDASSEDYPGLALTPVDPGGPTGAPVLPQGPHTPGQTKHPNRIVARLEENGGSFEGNRGELWQAIGMNRTEFFKALKDLEAERRVVVDGTSGVPRIRLFSQAIP